MVKKLPVQTAGAQVSSKLPQEGQSQVLVLDFMEEGQKLLDDLFIQSEDLNNKKHLFIKMSPCSSQTVQERLLPDCERTIMKQQSDEMLSRDAGLSQLQSTDCPVSQQRSQTANNLQQHSL